VLANPGWAENVLARAHREFLTLNTLPDGHDTWQDYAASLFAAEYNAARAEGLSKADAADAWCVARHGEDQLRELAELTSRATAIKAEIKRNESIVRKPTRDSLLTNVQQAKLQRDVFERVGESTERANERLEKAEQALRDFDRQLLGERVEKALIEQLKVFDTAHRKLADRAQPFVTQAQAALASGDFEEVSKLTEQIRQTLAPQIDWQPALPIVMQGASVHH
jgi:hypothetical protein